MEENFEQLVSALPLSSTFTFGIREITNILEKQIIDFSPSFIPQSYQSLCILESWAWKILSKDSYQWVHQPNYLHLFKTLALFNKNLILNYDSIENHMKPSLLMPESTEQINGIFEQIERNKDENDSFISIICLWFDNLSLFVHENADSDTFPIICYMNQCIARDYLMTDSFLFFLTELQQVKLPQSIFTNRQSFYMRTCLFSLSSYLIAKTQNFIYTSEEMMKLVDHYFIKIIEIQSHIIEIWSEELLSCITHLIDFISACCWSGGENLIQTNNLFSSEQMIYSYINALVRIISYKPFYSHIMAQWSNNETILIDVSLFSLKNLVQMQDLIWYFRSKVSLPDTLLSIAGLSIHHEICLRSYIILGEIISNENLKDLKITDNLCLFFYDMLEHAWQNQLKRYKQIPIYHLLRGFSNLSKIDTIQQKTADLNKVELLIEICEQYPITFDILWALSFNCDIQKQLRSNVTFMSKLCYLAKECDDEKLKKMTHGILWNLELNRNERPTSDRAMFDIMISYSHKDEIMCKDIYEDLTKSGYRVWIDFDQMHGNVMDAMARAIETSNTIIICMSEQYRRSNYCRAEAQYAFQCQRKIVPILLQKHYKPDGWLLFLIGQLFFIDFTKYEFSRAMELLIAELKVEELYYMNRKLSRIRFDMTSLNHNSQISTKRLSTVKLPKHIHNWTKANVHDWLVENNLNQMSRILINFDGRGLLYFNNFIKNGETKQIVNILQSESLRQIHENISLIELSNLRSLIDQQKNAVKSTGCYRIRRERRNRRIYTFLPSCHLL